MPVLLDPHRLTSFYLAGELFLIAFNSIRLTSFYLAGEIFFITRSTRSASADLFLPRRRIIFQIPFNSIRTG